MRLWIKTLENVLPGPRVSLTAPRHIEGFLAQPGTVHPRGFEHLVTQLTDVPNGEVQGGFARYVAGRKDFSRATLLKMEKADTLPDTQPVQSPRHFKPYIYLREESAAFPNDYTLQVAIPVPTNRQYTPVVTENAGTAGNPVRTVRIELSAFPGNTPEGHVSVTVAISRSSPLSPWVVKEQRIEVLLSLGAQLKGGGTVDYADADDKPLFF